VSRKGRLPADRNEFVLLAQQEFIASNEENRLPNEPPITAAEAKRKAEEIADTLPQYREQKQTQTREQAMQDFNNASPAELDQLRRDQQTLEASARFLGVSPQELNRMIDDRQRAANIPANEGPATGAPQR
jgi:hypothetical protein